MLPATLQFLIATIACAINDRMQRKLDCTAANQDIADDPSRNCNTLEIAEEFEVSGVAWTGSRQASQDSSRLYFMRADLACARAAARSTGICSPWPKYISSGVWPAKAECGTTEFCCST